MRTAVCVVAAFLLLAGVAWSADGSFSTEAVDRSRTAAEHDLAIRVTPGAAPPECALTGEMARLMGNRGYPGAPTAEDLGFAGPLCEIDCGPCDWSEQEPICEDDWVDIWDGGCNSSPNVFRSLVPYYGRITLCGTSGNYLVGTDLYRDTDWYEIVLTEATDISFGCTAEFPLQIVLIDGTAGCDAFTILDIQAAGACVEARIQQTIGPGTFWLWVGPSVLAGVPCGSEYMMTIDGYEAESCIADCPFGAVHENEETCYPGYVDAWNGGCNSVPNVFQELDPSAGTITVCGEMGVYPYGTECWRDTDWYQITLDQPRTIEACGYGEATLQLFIVGGTCAGGAYPIDAAIVPACTLACVSAALDPGTYWIWAGPGTWMPLDCGTRYTVTVTGYTTPVEHRSWGTIKCLYR
jgi:hypothetical protein